MYEVIVDGESLKDLIFVTDVNRTMGPFVKGRTVTIHAYILHDILATVDVLNKLLTGEMQEFIFTDQPDRYWKGKVKEDIKVPSSFEITNIDIDIEIPDGVSHAVDPKELSFSGRTSLILDNEGSDYAYPTFDFKLKEDTYMVSAVSKDRIFQFGEPIEASPLKEITVTKEKTTDGYEAIRSYTCINKRIRDLSASSYDVSKINPNWRTAGTFIERKKSMPAPSNGKIKIGKWATHWQTGERIASWVKGKTFVVAQTKNVRQSKSSKAYLLKNRGVYIGWLLEQDIDGDSSTASTKFNNGNPADLIASWATNQGYHWHGPCKKFNIDVECNDFEMSTFLNYWIGNNNQYGAYYVAVMSGDEVIMGTSISTHKNNRSTLIYFDANNKGVNSGGNNKASASYFWGKISMRKKGDKMSFTVKNDLRKKTFSKTYHIKSNDLKPTHIIIWAGKYGNNHGPSELSLVSLKFVALDAKVYIKPKTEMVKEVMNVPDPRYTFNAGDVIRLEMETNKAYVNGIETLSPIAFGSDTVRLKPGENEIMFDISSDVVPDIDVFYRERFK